MSKTLENLLSGDQVVWETKYSITLSSVRRVATHLLVLLGSFDMTKLNSSILCIKKEGDCSPSLDHQMPGMICPVVAYDPMAAITPIIAAHPLMRSAFSVI